MNGHAPEARALFIDQMATLLASTGGTRPAFCFRPGDLYPMRHGGALCKSDIQPLFKLRADPATSPSIFQAVVDQSVTGLALGRGWKATLLSLAGPLVHYEDSDRRVTSLSECPPPFFQWGR
jgi:hypothetical protein